MEDPSSAGEATSPSLAWPTSTYHGYALAEASRHSGLLSKESCVLHKLCASLRSVEVIQDDAKLLLGAMPHVAEVVLHGG